MNSTWPTKNLGAVCNVIGGGTPSKKNAAFYSGNIPWATVRDMRNSPISETEFSITSDAVRGSSTNVISGGNVIIATRVGLGKVCMLGQDTAINQDLRGVVPKSVRALDVGFLFWWLKSVSATIVAEGTGATVQGVKLPFIKSLQIPLPPLPEQKRIVAILDQTFAGIDAAVANTEKNLANARELFESYLNGVFTRKGDGWVKKKLVDVVDSSCSLSYGIVQPGNEFGDGLPVVRPTDLKQKKIAVGGLKRINPELAESYTRTSLHGGELLLCVRGSTGLVSIAAEGLKGANVTRGIVPIRFDTSLICRDFGYYALISKAVQSQIKEGTYGAALMQINIRDLKNILVTYPQLSVQEGLLNGLNSIAEDTQHLESIYQQKLTALAELKQSILQKAFAGKL